MQNTNYELQQLVSSSRLSRAHPRTHLKYYIMSAKTGKVSAAYVVENEALQYLSIYRKCSRLLKKKIPE